MTLTLSAVDRINSTFERKYDPAKAVPRVDGNAPVQRNSKVIPHIFNRYTRNFFQKSIFKGLHMGVSNDLLHG